MVDPESLRRVDDEEFDAWARAVANTYGEDLDEAQLRHARTVIELDRTIGAFDGQTPVGGTAAFTRSMTIPGAVQPIAAVTWVGVSPTHRRRGILTSMMREQLTDLHESGGEPIAALHASEAGIYGRFGYGLAARGGQLEADRRGMTLRSDVDLGGGTVRLLDRGEAGPLLAEVYEAVRGDAVGWLDRGEAFWNALLRDDRHARDGATSVRFAVHRDPDGRATDYVLYQLRTDGDHDPNGTVRVVELAAATRQAYAALWQFLVSIDLLPRISCEIAVDEPLPHLLVNPRAARPTVVDRLWVRLVDVDRALTSRRYATPLDLVLDVEDSFCPWNAGRYRLLADGDAVTCERTRSAPDLRLSSTELGAALLGGTTLSSLAAAGRVEELRRGATARATTAFRGEREPFLPSGASFPGV